MSIEELSLDQVAPLIPGSGKFYQDSRMVKEIEGYEAKYRVPWKNVQKGIDQGYIIPGWGLADYIRAAVKGNPNDIFARHGIAKTGLEVVGIWGKQGSTKSNFAWQLLDLLYQHYPESGKHMVVTMPDLLANYQVVKGKHGRLMGIVLDDLTTLIPKQLWFKDPDLHILLQQFLAAMRTKVGYFGDTLPNCDFTWDSIKEVTSIEIIVYPNGMYKVERYCWDTSEFAMKSNFYKVVIEQAFFDPLQIPLSEWEPYQVKREAMADDLFGRLIKRWGMSQQDGGEIVKTQLHRAITEMAGSRSQIIDNIRARGRKIKTETANEFLKEWELMLEEKLRAEVEKGPSQ